ncbi:uncharacterized protein LOC143145007 [Ptiloglossa arizonensis]|uniref:uncharacterized protein LOC143145007 n=1 Tax=Ptiloglossa arizonensis TaxID=3350558 RepID=UPI003F9EECDB
MNRVSPMASTDGSQGFRKLTRKFDKVSRGGERAREKLRCFEASAFQRRDVHRKVYRDQCCWKISLKLGTEERGKGSSEIEDRREVLRTRGAEQRKLRHRPIFPHSSKPSSESFFPPTLIATVFRACSNIWVYEDLVRGLRGVLISRLSFPKDYPVLRVST